MMRALATVTLALLLCRCGGNSDPDFGGTGGSISLSEPNVVAVTVDPGPLPPPNSYTNGLFVTITLCVPGTATCQTIDHLLVDTGSVGVRVLESELDLALPSASDTPDVEWMGCAAFIDGNAWGPIRIADVKVGGQIAANLAIQAIGESTFPVPPGCRQGGPPINDLESLGSKGIFGIGVLPEDCGVSCAPGTTWNVGQYYACSRLGTAGCSKTAVPIAKQVANPVAKFPVDNNGSLIRLPRVSASGAPSVVGLLAFGIGTQPNNGLGDARILAADENGFVTTSFPVGVARYSSYIDSGSNGLYFLDEATSGLRQCTTPSLADFYCDTRNLRASLAAQDGTEVSVSFSVADASRLPGSAYALSNLAGPMPGFPSASLPGFVWGLPFYFGRTVFTSIVTQEAPLGTTPYFAF